MTAKEIAEKWKVKEIDPWEDQSAKWAVGLYVFTAEELQSFVDALCKEQRSACLEAYEDTWKSASILTAPQPEAK